MSVFRNRKIAIALGATTLHLVVFFTVSYLLSTHGSSMQILTSQSDQHEYMLLAEQMLSEHRFALYPEFPPETFRTPLYPLLIALISFLTHSFWALFVVHAVLVGLIVYLSIKIGELLLPPQTARIAGIIFGISSGPLISTVMGLGSDLLYTLLFTYAAFFLFISLERPQKKNMIAMGILLGLATLTRPVGILASIPLFLAIFLIPVVHRIHIRYFALSVACFVLVLSPWYIRNASLSGSFFLSTIPAYNFAYYNAVWSEAFWNRTSEATERTKLLAHLGTEEPYALRLHTFAPQLTHIQNEYIRTHFIRYSIFHGIKTVPFFVGSGYNVINAVLAKQSPSLHIPLFPTESSNLTTALTERDVVKALGYLKSYWFVTLERIIWLCAIIASLIAPLFARGTARRILIIGALVVLSTIILVSPVTQARYRMPAEPFIWVGAVYVFFRLKQKIFPLK